MKKRGGIPFFGANINNIGEKSRIFVSYFARKRRLLAIAVTTPSTECVGDNIQRLI